MNPLLLRAAHVVAGLIYALFFLSVYESYISVVWAYLLFTYFEPSLLTMTKILAMVGLVSACLPVRIERPSALILWFAFGFVFVPTVTVSYCITSDPAAYDALLVAMTAAMSAMALVASAPLREQAVVSTLTDPPKAIVVTFMAAWAALSAVLFVYFLPILSLAGVNEVYEQREVALGFGTSGLISYARTYYASFVCPALLAYALMSKRWIYAAPALGGFLLAYSIGAEKAILILPVLIILVYLSRRLKVYLTVAYTSALVVLSAFCSLLTSHTSIARFFADMVLMRAIAVPGQTLSQYHDYFSRLGFTWWSHVRFLNWFSAAPPGLANDPQWPEIGRMVGGAYYGFSRGQNSNANPFVGEGVAAADWLGILVIGAVLSIWLRMLDTWTKRWSPTFVLLLMTPIAMTLTNVQLSTTLLSHGAALWTLIFLVSHRSGKQIHDRQAGSLTPGFGGSRSRSVGR